MKASEKPKKLPEAVMERQDDTTTAPIIAEEDILKFFNIQREDVQKFAITHKSDGLYINIRLNPKYHQCPVCGQKVRRIKDYCTKKIVHSVLTSQDCYIIYEARRYQCPHCRKIFFEHNPFAFGSSRISIATVSNVLRDLKSPNATFKDVADRYHISPTTAIRIFDEHVHISRRPLPEYLAIDEVCAFRSYDNSYVCVLVDVMNRKVVDILPSRRKYDIMNYFMLMPRKEREKVRYCSFDMWETYRVVAKHVFPNVKCCVDRFHVMQELGRRLETVRISIQKRFRSEKDRLKPPGKAKKDLTRKERYLYERASRHYYVLKKFHWLLYSTDNKILDSNVEKRYNSVLNGYYNYDDLRTYMRRLDKDLDIACHLHYLMTEFYRNPPKNAEERLNEIIVAFRDCPIGVLSQFASTLTRWKREIVNSLIVISIEKSIKRTWKDGRLVEEEDTKKRKMNTSVVENRNRTIKLIKNSSNGYLNWERAAIRCCIHSTMIRHTI